MFSSARTLRKGWELILFLPLQSHCTNQSGCRRNGVWEMWRPVKAVLPQCPGRVGFPAVLLIQECLLHGVWLAICMWRRRCLRFQSTLVTAVRFHYGSDSQGLSMSFISKPKHNTLKPQLPGRSLSLLTGLERLSWGASVGGSHLCIGRRRAAEKSNSFILGWRWLSALVWLEVRSTYVHIYMEIPSLSLVDCCQLQSTR